MWSEQAKAAAKLVCNELLAYWKRWEAGDGEEHWLNGIEPVLLGDAIHSAVVSLEQSCPENRTGTRRPLPRSCISFWRRFLRASRCHRFSALGWADLLDDAIAHEFLGADFPDAEQRVKELCQEEKEDEQKALLADIAAAIREPSMLRPKIKEMADKLVLKATDTSSSDSRLCQFYFEVAGDLESLLEQDASNGSTIRK